MNCIMAFLLGGLCGFCFIILVAAIYIDRR